MVADHSNGRPCACVLDRDATPDITQGCVGYGVAPEVVPGRVTGRRPPMGVVGPERSHVGALSTYWR